MIHHRIQWLVGLTAVCSGLVLVASRPALTIPSTQQASVLSAADQSLALHSNGIQKALEGDYASAIQDYDRALILTPNHHEVYYNRAVAYYSVGDSEKAVEDLDRAIQLQPTMAEAFANRGMMRLEMGDPKGALEDSEQAADLFDQQGDPALAKEIRTWINQQVSVVTP